MKKYFLSICFLAFNFVFSQTLYGEIEYEIQFPNPTNSLEEKKAILKFNDSESLFCYNRNDLVNKESNFEKNQDGINIKVVLTDSTGSFVYRNFKKEAIFFRNVKSKFLNATYVNDNWQNINWAISKDTLTIGNFKCTKALGKFRGRNYTAWFTEEIPIPYGPWKLFGLPGLIIDAHDETKEFRVRAKVLNINTTPIKIKKPLPENNDYVLEYKEYLEFKKKEKKIFVENFKSKLPRGIKFNLNEKDIKTNPTEIEWEK